MRQGVRVNQEPLPAAIVPTALYAPTAKGQRKLRVAAMVDRDVVPAWIGETLAAIAACEATELAAILVVAGPSSPAIPSALRMFLGLDSLLAGRARAATAPSRLAARLPEARMLRVGGTEREGRLVLDADGQALVRVLDADLMIGFGLPPAARVLAGAARKGAWFFERHATDARYCGLRFLEPIWRGEAVTPSGVIVHMSDADAWQRLGVSWNATAQLSFARNRAYQLLRIPAELTRVLRKVAADRPVERETVAEVIEPGAFAMCGFLLRLVLRGLRRHLPRLGKVESWVLGLRRSERSLVDSAQREGLRVLEPPKGLFWADPFAVRHEGHDYVFVEECPLGGRGRIAVFALDERLEVTKTSTVIERPWHLSYPIVFDWKGARHLITESSAAGTLTLYRCIEFPHRWETVTNIIEGRAAVDGTLHFDGQRWFLFVAVSESPLDVDPRIWCDLFVFWALDPAGPWHPHAANPVLSDVRRARPAGAFFRHEGRLIRPAQDCSTDYGYAIVFHEVLRLDPDHYEERVIGRLDPDWAPGLRGCHTYARCGTLEIVDGKVLVPSRSQRGDLQNARPSRAED